MSRIKQYGEWVDPTWVHDCNRCEFLGVVNEIVQSGGAQSVATIDVYVCFNSSYMPSLGLRRSDDSADYESYPLNIALAIQDRPYCHYIKQALNLVFDKFRLGLIRNEEEVNPLDRCNWEND